MTKISSQIFQDLILSRSKQFIDRFNTLDNHIFNCQDCPHAPNAFFLCTYGLKILLDDNSWAPQLKPIIAHFQKENEVIWNFLTENNMIPDNYQKEFIEYAKTFATESIDDSYDDVFLAPLETLLKNGASLLDLDLYRASASLEFEETKKLLQSGANPDANILISEGEEDEYPEFWSSIGFAGGQWDDAYCCLNLHNIWEEEFKNGVKYPLPDSIFYQIITSAAYKLMYELLESYTT